jgi:hypothetical protein
LVANVETSKAVAEATTTVLVGDTTPPVTTASVAGPAGNNGWYRGPVAVTLIATDPDSPVAATYYSVDGGSTLTYNAPFAVSSDGVHQIAFSSVDPVGNQEQPKRLSIRIDSTPPLTSVTPSTTTLWPPNGSMTPVMFSGTVTDVTSGVDPSSISFVVTDEYGVVHPSGMVTLAPNGSYSFAIPLQASRFPSTTMGGCIRSPSRRMTTRAIRHPVRLR